MKEVELLNYQAVLNDFWEKVYFKKTDFHAFEDENTVIQKLTTIRNKFESIIDAVSSDYELEHNIEKVVLKKATYCVIFNESEGNPDAEREIGNWDISYGLMQLTPKTAIAIAKKYFSDDEMFLEFMHMRETGSNREIIERHPVIKELLKNVEINIRLGLMYIVEGIDFYKDLVVAIGRYNSPASSLIIKRAMDLYKDGKNNYALKMYRQASKITRNYIFKVFNRNDGTYWNVDTVIPTP